MKEQIEAEQKRIEAALSSGKVTDKQYCELYAARQALVWAIDPQGAKAPYETVLLNQCQPLIPEGALMHGVTDIREDSANCSAPLRPQ